MLTRFLALPLYLTFYASPACSHGAVQPGNLHAFLPNIGCKSGSGRCSATITQASGLFRTHMSLFQMTLCAHYHMCARGWTHLTYHPYVHTSAR